MNWFLVFLGGGIGACLRYGIGLCAQRVPVAWPLGTFISNAIASALIGFLAFYCFPKGTIPTSKMWLFLATGVCGGLSTFSTFSLESVWLWQAGQYTWFFSSVIFQVIVCVAIVAVFARLSALS